MTFKYSDGELVLHEEGNTVIGETAHKLYFLAAKEARINNLDFQTTLKVMAEMLDKRINELKAA